MTIQQLQHNKEIVTKQLSALEFLRNISLDDKATLQVYYRKKLGEYQKQIEKLSSVFQSNN